MAAQGIAKTVAYKKQTGLGAAASGSGGQLLRTRTTTMNLARDTYQNDERTSHRQSTGATAGIKRGSGTINGLLSPKTFADFFSSLVKKAWVATSNLTALSLTIAVSGQNWTITRGSGDFLTGGIKVGDVIRITAGSVNAANSQKNLFVLGVTATVLTVRPLNGVALVAEGPIASCTIAVPGKKAWGAISAHTDDWYTVEEVYTDLTPVRSELWTDTRIQQVQISVPATGNVTADFSVIPLNRVRGAAQVLTTPTAETTTGVVQAISAFIVIGGIVTPVTGLQLTITSGDNPGEPETGGSGISDVAKGALAVSGQFTAKMNHVSFQDAYDDQTPIQIFAAIGVDGTANSDFVAFSVPKVKLFGDAPDDGMKEIIRTYPFTAEINGEGGAALASHQTIVSIQDSQAP